jgi:hypothetical protein
MGVSRGGICSERPLERNSGRRGVVGLRVWSSFDMRAAGSRNFGDGSNRGVLSDSDRAFGDFWGVLASIAASARSSMVVDSCPHVNSYDSNSSLKVFTVLLAREIVGMHKRKLAV